jgi:hypothetical protein
MIVGRGRERIRVIVFAAANKYVTNGGLSRMN